MRFQDSDIDLLKLGTPPNTFKRGIEGGLGKIRSEFFLQVLPQGA